MTKEDALDLLQDAPADDKLSKVNKGLTRKQITQIVMNAVKSMADGRILDELFVKRVHQACQDRVRPDVWLK